MGWVRVLGLAGAVLCLAGSGTAHGAVTATTDARAVAQAMTRPAGLVTGAAFVESPPQKLSAAAANDPLAGFPTDGGSYAVLSSGDVANVHLPNDSPSTGTALGGGNVRDGAEQDVTVLRLDINVPAGTNCLTNMDFRFLSEEYPEYVGSGYNDAFIAELDVSTWKTTGDTGPVATSTGPSTSAAGPSPQQTGAAAITAERNFAFDPAGNPITVNAAGVTSMAPGGAEGTTFDGATPLLNAATPITPGAHSIYLTIFDLSDQAYDSMVMVDNLRFGKVANVSRDCKPGAQVVDERKYVALGDSYSSGFGVEPYLTGTHKGRGR